MRPPGTNRPLLTAAVVAACALSAWLAAPALWAVGAAEPARSPDVYSAFRLHYGIAAPVERQQSAVGLHTEMARTWAVPALSFLGMDGEGAFSFLPGPSGSFGEMFSDTAFGLGRLGLGLSTRIRVSERGLLYARGSGGVAATLEHYRLPFDVGYYYSVCAGVGRSFYDAFALGIEARYLQVEGLGPVLSATAGLEFNLPTAPRSGTPQRAVRHPAGDPTQASQPIVKGAAHPVPVEDNVPVAAARSPAVEALTRMAKADPHSHLENLVRELTAASTTGFDQARVIHDWIAMNIAYDCAACAGTAPTVTDPMAVIQRGASVCQGYSNVFQLMCNRAGLDCVVVSGYARGVGYDPFRDSDPPYDSNHAWNAVHIDGRWYLVDCTWDAGHVDSAMVFERRYSNEYLFADPEGFLHTHFPGASVWQLLGRPISYQEFCGKPCLTGAFFQWGLAVDPGTPNVIRVEDSAALRFSARPGAAVRGVLERTDGRPVDNAVREERGGGRTTLHVRFPAPGRYRLDLYAGRDGGTGTRLFYDTAVHAGCLILEVARASSEMFPRGY